MRMEESRPEVFDVRHRRRRSQYSLRDLRSSGRRLTLTLRKQVASWLQSGSAIRCRARLASLQTLSPMLGLDKRFRSSVKNRPGGTRWSQTISVSSSPLTKSFTTESTKITEGISDSHLCELCTLRGEAVLLFWSCGSEGPPIHASIESFQMNPRWGMLFDFRH